MVGQHVTIRGRSKKPKLPIIEDDVYIGSGAQILGDVRVGKGSIVGAGAIVLSDVPPKSIVVGIPAQVIRKDINKDDYV